MTNAIMVLAREVCGTCGHTLNKREFLSGEGEPYAVPVSAGSCTECGTDLSDFPPLVRFEWEPKYLAADLVYTTESVAFISAQSPDAPMGQPAEMVGAQVDGLRIDVGDDAIRVYDGMEKGDYRLLLQAARGRGDVRLFEKEETND